MKNSPFKNGLSQGFGIFLAIATLGVITVFAANWYDSILVTSGETLTAVKLNAIAKATTPTGAIMAFNLTTCPDTWLPADGTNGTPDLRGAFLRGMSGSLNGRDVMRTIGDYQTDAFQGHYHNVYDNYGGATTSAYWYDGTSAGMGAGYTRNTTPNAWGWMAKEAIVDGINGTPRIANETRPKNVAVLYCVKQ